MEKINSLNIFKAFFKIGLILLGGGYVIVPVMERELIEKRNWLSHDELIDFYCMAQSLPGIIAINTSILVASNLYKYKGAIVALFGLCLSPVISILILANFINQISNIFFMKHIFWGVNIAVIILVYLALREMWSKSMKNAFSYFWFFVILFLSFLKINPAILIILSIACGLIIQKVRNIKYE